MGGLFKHIVHCLAGAVVSSIKKFLVCAGAGSFFCESNIDIEGKVVSIRPKSL